jgi:hypothetical protein
MSCNRVGDMNEIYAESNKGMIWEDIEKASEK